MGTDQMITFSLKNSHGQEKFFKMHTDNELFKVFERYSSDLGVDASSLRFLFDGERLDGNQTPKGIEMEQNDCIDVFEMQTGG